MDLATLFSKLDQCGAKIFATDLEWLECKTWHRKTVEEVFTLALVCNRQNPLPNHILKDIGDWIQWLCLAPLRKRPRIVAVAVSWDATWHQISKSLALQAHSASYWRGWIKFKQPNFILTVCSHFYSRQVSFPRPSLIPLEWATWADHYRLPTQ